jgi:hypothetical protein
MADSLGKLLYDFIEWPGREDAEPPHDNFSRERKTIRGMFSA